MTRAAGLMLLAVLASGAHAAGEGVMYTVDVDLSDVKSLQRGARTFVNYCLSCHSASYMRYSSIARDLQLPEDLVAENLMFATDKLGDVMQVAMRPEDAAQWFGVAPPDLSVIARARGADWLYTFLLTFYHDPARPTGVNNLAFKDTAMPHVLWELQGLQRLVTGSDDQTHGEGAAGHDFEPMKQGRLNEQEYHKTVKDLVAFLVYLGEPAKLVRYRVGAWVIIFLVVFLAISYLLKREYWKDVH